MLGRETKGTRSRLCVRLVRGLLWEDWLENFFEGRYVGHRLPQRTALWEPYAVAVLKAYKGGRHEPGHLTQVV